jgi:hypothetical protein
MNINFLYTYGNEYVTEPDGKDYKGFYHIHDGIAYALSSTSDTKYKLVSKREINAIKIATISGLNQTSQNSPERLKSAKIRSIYPSVTDEDRARGYMTRYFAKHKLYRPYWIFEIDQEEHVNITTADDLPYILYESVELSWLISDMGGQVDVAAMNLKNLTSIEANFKGIIKYFVNLKEFSEL